MPIWANEAAERAINRNEKSNERITTRVRVRILFPSACSSSFPRTVRDSRVLDSRGSFVVIARSHTEHNAKSDMTEMAANFA